MSDRFKGLYSQKSRTALLCAFAFVTALVIWRASSVAGTSDSPLFVVSEGEAELRHHERMVEQQAVEIEAQAEAIEAEVERIIAGTQAEIEARVEQLTNEKVWVEQDKAWAEAERELSMREAQKSLSKAEALVGSIQDGMSGDPGELMIEREFMVSDASGLLDVKLKGTGADVDVLPASGGRAKIQVYLKGKDMDRARRYFEDLDFEVNAERNEITVRAENRRKGWNNWRSRGGAQVYVRAEVPVSYDADVETSGGDVTVVRLEGRAEVRTSGGDVTLGDLKSPSVSVHTSGGDIEADSIEGPTELRTSGGDIEVGMFRADRLDASTSGGDIDVRNADARDLRLRTSGGDITLANVTGDVEAGTSGGDIEATSLNGALQASTTGGDIEVSLRGSHDLDLSTTGGSIDIDLPSNASADLNIRGGRVALDDDFRFSGTLKKNRAEGRVNGGGARISARTSGGTVRVDAN